MTISVLEVKEVCETSKSDSTVQAHIDTAQLVVDETLASSGLSEARLDKIVMYLAAHFLSLSEGAEVRRSKMGDADESYVTPNGKMQGFQITRYGQQALALDTSGKLAASQASGGLKAEFRVI